MRFSLTTVILPSLFVSTAGVPIAEEPLLHHESNSQTISAALFAELEELSRLVDISYCVGTGTGLGIFKPFKCLGRCKDFSNFELVTTWNTGPLMSDSCGYIALSHPPNPPRIIVAFRGTYSVSNTIADLSSLPQDYSPYPDADDGDDSGDPTAPKCPNCTVHSGFYTSWRHTRAQILPHIAKASQQHPTYALTMVGHSLGGAVATLAGLELLDRGFASPSEYNSGLTVTTFGAPRLGNAAFTSYIDARFNLSSSSSVATSSAETPDPNTRPFRRVTHMGDPVPLLPPEEWTYAPHAGEIFIAKPELPPSLADVRHCDGAADAECIAHGMEQGDDNDDFGNAEHGGYWGIPARLKLWQIFFAHRDYFWRLGLCVPGGDPFWRWEDGAGKAKLEL